MPKYIDCEAAKKALTGWDTDPTDEEIEYTLDKIPAADVVEAAKCRNCVYSYWKEESSTSKAFMCRNPNGLYDEIDFDDFCSYSKRKTN